MPPAGSAAQLSQSTCQPLEDLAARLPCLLCTVLVLSLLILTALLLRLLSPTRLCRQLDDCLRTTERLYHGSLIGRVLNAASQNDIAKDLLRLQQDASHIHERRLRNVLRPWCTVWDVLRGQSLVIARCIWDATVLQNRIEVLQEIRLRENLLHMQGGSPASSTGSGLLICDCH
ncbi:hypothetical protein GGX14DRAFT_443518 [Mycena pura]|uniref:Uncharacterized protein n=1 Tax=Mycena pura TaxID=153505 RepID=A0AAD6VN18_9AGAR|nr:hypothetical protein GGX14DRAFT_443518 [Mycena pura]